MSSVERIKKISTLLDSQYTGPFGFKFGLDPLIGLVPVVGDALTSLVSFYVVLEAYHLGCGPSILLRMTFNIFLENLVKVIPFVGQLFDFFWKSNTKNLALLETYMRDPRGTQKKSTLFLIFLVILFIAIFVSFIAASIALATWLIRRFSGESY